MTKKMCIAMMAIVMLLTACGKPQNSEPTAAQASPEEMMGTGDGQANPTSPVAEEKIEKSAEAPANEVEKVVPKGAEDIAKAQQLMADKRFDEALHLLYDAETKLGSSAELTAAYDDVIAKHPDLNAKPRQLIVGQDLTGMKRLGGGSSLVYRFLKDKQTIAAFKPFQKRFQSNYRSEIAAYRLCPKMKCGFDVPLNVPVYFDFDAFSSLYGRNPANPKDEFKEIIPTKLENGKYRVDGTFKAWIPDYADYPIEFTEIWQPWLNPGTSKDALMASVTTILPSIEKRHKRGSEVVKKLAPHVENLSIYGLARQISNLIVFDFLINNWDRFSGAQDLKGVNCQMANGRFMSIDNGASFSQTPHEKPAQHLKQVTRFSRMTYDAIKRMDKAAMLDYLFPEATEYEKQKLDTFWNLRQAYLDYVDECVKANGEAETFFFE